MKKQNLSRNAIDLPLILREAEVSSFDKEKKTAKMIFSEGTRGLRNGWDGTYYEELSLDPKHVRLDRVAKGAVPFMKDHGGFFGASIDDVMGRVTEAKVDGKKGEATVQFSEREDVQPYLRDIEQGILKSVSVGYRVHKMEKVGEEDGIPILRATDWELFEISSVAMPFDASAQFRSEGKKEDDKPILNRCEVVGLETKTETTEVLPEKTVETRADLPHDKKIGDIKMNEAEQKAALEAKRLEEKAIADKAREAEKTRTVEIRKAVKIAKLDDAFAEDLVSRNVEIDAARSEIISKLEAIDKEKETRTMNITHGGQDEVQTRRNAIEEAILHRGDRSRFKVTELGRSFAGLSLQDMAREYLVQSGTKDARFMSGMEVAKRAFHSTSDFPQILANVMGKSLRDGYQASPQTFDPFTRRVQNVDFKEVSRLQLGMGSKLEKLNQNGNITFGTMSETAEKYKVETYAKGLALGFEMIVNDDLDAFVRAPSQMGMKARSLESDLVWSIITANAAMSDTFALFSVEHGNLAGAGAAIDISSLGAGRSAMRVQKDPDGEPLNLSPAWLIVPSTKESLAEQFVSVMQPNQASSVNPFAAGGRSALQIIVEPRLDAASIVSWYLAANKSSVDIIELATLSGSGEPEIATEQVFDNLGMKMRVVHHIGAKAIDHRGLYKNPGA